MGATNFGIAEALIGANKKGKGSAGRGTIKRQKNPSAVERGFLRFEDF